jgi:hypothetical protein
VRDNIDLSVAQGKWGTKRHRCPDRAVAPGLCYDGWRYSYGPDRQV